MRRITYLLLIMVLTGCGSDDLSWISIHNNTEIPIYAMPYSSEFANGEWIQPGLMDEFYSINCKCLDGFTYFTTYYDSLIIFMKGQGDDPIKFYRDGTAINYDPTQNPFTNPDVWATLEYDQTISDDQSNSDQEEKHISEHYFSIDAIKIKSLADTTLRKLDPDS
jgi:hypothetical protein